MKFQFCMLVLVFVAIDNVQNLPLDSNNNSTVSLVQSTYAKVTKWGASPTISAINEGRSNNGQTLFSQRSDVNIINGQNLKKPETRYHYSMLKNNRSSTLSRSDHRSQEKLKAGEEIQFEKRYNPKPYFDYSQIPPKANKMPQSDKGTGTGDDLPSVVYGTPFDSFPSFPKSIPPPKTTVDIKPSINLYNSPYDSYNPPASNSDAKPAPGPIYPPNDMPPSAPTYLPPSNNYLPSKEQKKPLTVPAMSMMMNKPSGMKIETVYNYHGPYAPPRGSDAIETPKDDEDDNHGDHHHYHDNGDDGESENGPPIVKTVDAPMDAEQPYYEHPPKGYYHHRHHQQEVDMADMMSNGGDDDMSPPPATSMVDMRDHHHGSQAAPSAAADDGSSDLSPPPNGGSGASDGNRLPIMPKLPEYMDHDPTTNGAGNYHGYEFDHHHHYEDHPPIQHVYHEVHTTTTTEAPVDERVNKGHYSYYYLGRKLWYIPLYFSVYFILYITALILKSIARHKVNLVHEYPKEKGRSYNSAGRLDIDEIQRKVARAVDQGAQKYAM